MATHENNPTPSAPERRFRIAHLFHDPVLRAVFAAAERDVGMAPALARPGPRILTGGAALRVPEMAD